MITRRQFTASAPGLLGSAIAGTVAATGCVQKAATQSYEAAAADTWRLGPLKGLEGAALGKELVRYATLAPSSHNTQCWRFKTEPGAITILADLSRRCPAVDPDDHHLYVSLGCATENLVQAAQAHGLRAQPWFDTKIDAVRIALTPASAVSTERFKAIASRQCTRGDYDAVPLKSAELKLLEAADKASWVEVGRSYERFALQATALGIRNAMINQPVEVAAARPLFASAWGLGAARPDLIVRFGRGAAMRQSLRRSVDAVLV